LHLKPIFGILIKSLKDIIGFNKRKRVVAPIQLNRGRKVRTPVPHWGTSVRVNDPPRNS